MVLIKYLIIKCGGSILNQLPDSFYQNIVQLKNEGEWMPVIVHGGGPHISTLLNELKITSTFKNGLRVTTPEMLDVIEMVLSGSTNKTIVRKLRAAGGKGFGMSGVDGDLIQAKPIDQANLGFVGEVTNVDYKLIETISDQDLIPVISPIGIAADGQHYNINADTAAAAISQHLQGSLCFVSDIPGILVDGEVVRSITEQEVIHLIEAEIITGGMIPKVLGALNALKNAAKETVIINGCQENSLLDFCNGKKAGTTIKLSGEISHV